MNCDSLVTFRANLSILAHQSSFVKGVENQQLSTRDSSWLVIVDFDTTVMTGRHDFRKTHTFIKYLPNTYITTNVTG